MGLGKYNKKRDFRITAEPRGELGRSKSGRSYFIQKHAASHLHFDFRLELNGVLKSWAVPKGPSVFPGVRRLAVEVEDHPLNYGNFEGTIPEGEYGGGTVMLWDQGTWSQPENASKSLHAGKITFRLEGKRLKGYWTLVRSRPDAKGKNLWFLIKSKDQESSGKTIKAVDDPAEIELTSVVSDRSMKEIAAGNVEWSSKKQSRQTASCVAATSKADQSANAENKSEEKSPRRSTTIPQLPKGFKPQVATLVDRAPSGDDWIHEIKFDGYRMIAVIEEDQVSLFSRNGLDWTIRLQMIADALAQLKLGSCILDGEVVAADKEGRSDFQALQLALKENAQKKLRYYVFDVLSGKKKDLRNLPLSKRKEILQNLFKNNKVKDGPIALSESVVGNGQGMFEEAARLGLEGIISKKMIACIALEDQMTG